MPAPTLGRIVHYRLGEQDLNRIQLRLRRDTEARCNTYRKGDTVAALVVRVWDDGTVNLRLILDGDVDLWVTSRPEGILPGTWCWPPRA